MTDDGPDAWDKAKARFDYGMGPEDGDPPREPDLKERNASALSGIDHALRGILRELKATNSHLSDIERQLSSLRSQESQEEEMDQPRGL